MYRLNNRFLFFGVALASVFAVALSSCGHPDDGFIIDDPDECERIIQGHIPVPDSVLLSDWFDEEIDEIVFVNQKNEELVYNRNGENSVRKYALDQCGLTFTGESHSITFETEALAPQIRLAVGTNKWNAEGKTHQTYIAFNVWNNSLTIRADSMTSTSFNMQYFPSLDTLGTHFDSCYLYSWVVTQPTQLEGMVYTLKDGLAGFYFKNGFYWRRR